MCVSTILRLKSTLPSPDGTARFVLLLNSRCHSRPPTCWETAKCPQSVPVVSSLFLLSGDPRVLTPPIWTLQPSAGSARWWPWCIYVCARVPLCWCEALNPSFIVVHLPALQHSACAALLTLMFVCIPVGFWLQQAHTWTFLWIWGLWGRCECCDHSNWSQESLVRTSIATQPLAGQDFYHNENRIRLVPKLLYC